MFKKLFHLWALSLGEKAHEDDNMADKVAIIRTIIFATYLITNCFIIANAIRHWNDKEIILEVKIYENPNYSKELYTKEWNGVGVERNARIEGVYHTGTVKVKEREFK